MTDRLYYDDPYLLTFTANVVRSEVAGETTRVWLDRSAFYPTSGGQPCDFGMIKGQKVLDVLVEDGDVVHIVEGALETGTAVRCEIDAERRGDHMRQHCGEHMLAYTVWKRYAGFTHGLHIGETFSTIDVTMPDGSTRLEDAELRSLEEEVNEWIQRDEMVRCWFPTPEEMPHVPLRKETTVKEHIRIVHIAPDEYVACGGTHPRRTGEVGCIRLLDAKPSRGKLRLSFVCGMRAVRDGYRKANACLRAAELLSSSWETLPESVQRLNERCAALSAEIRSLRKSGALARLSAQADKAEQTADGMRIVTARLDGLDAVSLREAVGELTNKGGLYVLAASRPEKDSNALLLFARSEGGAVSMGELLSETVRAVGGKGGGKPDFAQGATDDPDSALAYASAHVEK